MLGVPGVSWVSWVPWVPGCLVRAVGSGGGHTAIHDEYASKVRFAVRL